MAVKQYGLIHQLRSLGHLSRDYRNRHILRLDDSSSHCEVGREHGDANSRSDGRVFIYRGGASRCICQLNNTKGDYHRDSTACNCNSEHYDCHPDYWACANHDAHNRSGADHELHARRSLRQQHFDFLFSCCNTYCSQRLCWPLESLYR